MTGLPPILGYVLGTNEPPQDFRAYADGDEELYEKIAFALIQRGVMPDADGREPWFLSYSHDEQIIEETLAIYEDAVNDVRKKL